LIIFFSDRSSFIEDLQKKYISKISILYNINLGMLGI